MSKIKFCQIGHESFFLNPEKLMSGLYKYHFQKLKKNKNAFQQHAYRPQQ